ncbi:NADH-quinone oxidoreductase subunit NuoF [Rickettsiales bacterium LUAb2]
MLQENNKIFNNIYGFKGSGLNTARKLGDWEGTKEILSKGRDWIINELKTSALTGRGGAGFSAGMKWSFLNANDPRPKYLVVNADEGEPGTCKDREILRHEPHKLLEGILIACYVFNANRAYIYLRGEYMEAKIALEEAIEEAKANKLLGKNALGMIDLEINVHMGAGAYICGEETSLLESLEGKAGRPRNKPPFPANSGLYNCPTVINNVETIASVPAVLKRGANWFNGFGRGKTKGVRLFAISGMVEKPVIFEEELGVPIKELIDTYAGGVIGGWDNLRAIIPGGVSAQILNKATCDTMIMDPDSLREAGSTIGTACMIVFNNSINLLEIFNIITKFYMHESCGQCTPCREGSGWVHRILNKIYQGIATKDDVELLRRVAANIQGNTICGLGDAINMAVGGFLRAFSKEILEEVSK